jgi:DNA primase
MRFTQDFIDKVIHASDLVDLISQYTQLKPSGANLMGLCPFPSHKEKTPSFSVSPSKQLYHCFGCKKGGGPIHFLQDYNGMSFPEAIEYLASRASIAMPEDNKAQSQQEDQERQRKKYLERINELAREFYIKSFQTLHKDHPAKVYLQQRGIKQETIDTFQIGYAPDSWSSFSEFLAAKKVNLPMAQELGLIKLKAGGSYFDIFRNRILFPILSPMGKTLGFGGRVLSKEDQPKYLNSPESPLFHKSRTLYGLHETAKHILSDGYTLVVEGYMDLVSLYQAGVQNVVANLGTAFTPEHAKLLKKYSQNVVLLFDGDAAGQSATERALPILLREGLSAKALTLPNNMDPDDFVKAHGREELLKRIGEAKDVFVWFLQKCLKSFQGSATERVQILDQIFPILNEISDYRLASLYLNDVAYIMELDKKWLERAYNAYRKNESDKKPVTVTKQVAQSVQPTVEITSDISKLDISKALPEEIELANLLLAREEFLKRSLELNLHSVFVSESGKKMLLLINDEYRQDSSDFARLGASVLTKIVPISLLTKHADATFYGDTEKANKVFHLCFQKLNKEVMKRKLRGFRQDLKMDASLEDTLENMQNIFKNQNSKKET